MSKILSFPGSGTGRLFCSQRYLQMCHLRGRVSVLSEITLGIYLVPWASVLGLTIKQNEKNNARLPVGSIMHIPKQRAACGRQLSSEWPSGRAPEPRGLFCLEFSPNAGWPHPLPSGFGWHLQDWQPICALTPRGSYEEGVLPQAMGTTHHSHYPSSPLWWSMLTTHIHEQVSIFKAKT